MINLRKVLKIQFMCIIFITICVISANAYSVCLSNKIHLRVPIDSKAVQKRIIALYNEQKHKSVTKKRLEELSILVPRLREELGRRPSMTEVVAGMENITGKTLAKKVATLSMWMKTNGWVPEQFEIQKFAYSPEPMKVGFNFGGAYFNTPNELNGKIIVRQPSGVRLEITELVLEMVQKPEIALKLRLLENGDFELQFGDKVDIVKRPVDRTYVSIDTLLSTPAFIAFRDSVLEIPVEFGLDRKIALLNFLQKYGSKDVRGAEENSVYMSNCWFILPSYYRYGHGGDRIVAYRDRGNYINITALVEIKNPKNFFIFERRGDDFYSSESGQKLVSSGNAVEDKKLYYLKGSCGDFDNFNNRLDKIQADKHYFSSMDEIVRQVSMGQVTLTFWASVSISEDTIETQRTSPDEFNLFPVTLHRDERTGEILVRSYKGRKDAVTISGLNLSNGEPVILKGRYFNLSVILEMIRLGKFEGLVTADKLLTDTFYYRERPPHSGMLNPIRVYKFDKANGTIEIGDSIHPRDLPFINIETGRVDVPEQDLISMRRLFQDV